MAGLILLAGRLKWPESTLHHHCLLPELLTVDGQRTICKVSQSLTGGVHC
jgi:hypothetical protein